MSASNEEHETISLYDMVEDESEINEEQNDVDLSWNDSNQPFACNRHLEPCLNMIFDKLEDTKACYNAYARRKGFGIRVSPSISAIFVIPPFSELQPVRFSFSELRPHCSSFFRYDTFPFLISLRFASNRSFFLYIFFLFFLMYEYSEVRHHCLAISFIFAHLGALLGSGSGCLELRSFASEGGALGLVLVDLSHLLRQSLDWFRSGRKILTEVRSSKLDTRLSSGDKAVEVDIAVSASPSLKPFVFLSNCVQGFPCL